MQERHSSFQALVKTGQFWMETGKRTSQTIVASMLVALMQNDCGVCWFSPTQVKEDHGHDVQVMSVKSFGCQLATFHYGGVHCNSDMFSKVLLICGQIFLRAQILFHYLMKWIGF